MRKLMVVLAALAASVVVATPATACDRDCQRILLFSGAFALGRAPAAPPTYGGGYARQPAVIYVQPQPRVVYVPATTIVVAGAVDNGDGTCTQTNGGKGVILADGRTCFVPNRRASR